MINNGALKKKKSLSNKDWTNGPIVRNLLQLSWPMALMGELLDTLSELDSVVKKNRFAETRVTSS